MSNVDLHVKANVHTFWHFVPLLALRNWSCIRYYTSTGLCMWMSLNALIVHFFHRVLISMRISINKIWQRLA